VKALGVNKDKSRAMLKLMEGIVEEISQAARDVESRIGTYTASKKIRERREAIN
jgi:hypothetical protein